MTLVDSAKDDTRSLGHYVRLVRLACRQGGLIRPLADVELLPDEESSLRALLIDVRDHRWEDLKVESRGTWGALFLYSFARCRRAGAGEAVLFGAPLSPALVQALKDGAALWKRCDVPGGADELELLVSATHYAQLNDAPPPPDAPAQPVLVRRPPLHRASVQVFSHLLEPAVGCYCILLRAKSLRRTASDVLCTLAAVEHDVDLSIVHADGRPAGAEFRLVIDAPWQPVRFVVTSSEAKRAHVEVRPCAGNESFRATRLPGTFTTLRRLTPPPNSEQDAGGAVARFFQLLERHRAVSEEEALRIFGSQRALRRFALDFDSLVAPLPFRVRIEVTENGKRYIREG